ncbi:MAG: hypothetical protein E3J21_24060 [Anaerolineales bacterium]|nr:MAG: hypothetical protein E3J21_24060 [Anaerolineales bacterium]
MDSRKPEGDSDGLTRREVSEGIGEIKPQQLARVGSGHHPIRRWVGIGISQDVGVKGIAQRQCNDGKAYLTADGNGEGEIFADTDHGRGAPHSLVNDYATLGLTHPSQPEQADPQDKGGQQ